MASISSLDAAPLCVDHHAFPFCASICISNDLMLDASCRHWNETSYESWQKNISTQGLSEIWVYHTIMHFIYRLHILSWNVFWSSHSDLKRVLIFMSQSQMNFHVLIPVLTLFWCVQVSTVILHGYIQLQFHTWHSWNKTGSQN